MTRTLRLILFSAIVAGILDGISAVVFLGNMNFSGVWKFVASGYFGQEAFTSGQIMVVYGLLFHFCISTFWATFYFFVLRKTMFFSRNVIVGGIVYGIIVWTMMNLVVLPFTLIPNNALTLIGAVKNILILMLCIGLPISITQQKMQLK